MIRNASIAVAVAACSLLVQASAALAAASDPSQIGKHVEDIVSPNVKSFWKIAVLVGAVVTVFGRPKSSIVVAFWISIVVSGMVIYNPGGLANTVTAIGNKVL
jgi:hypothetical protein